MKWLLLLTILSGYSGSSTVAANFASIGEMKGGASRARTSPPLHFLAPTPVRNPLDR